MVDHVAFYSKGFTFVRLCTVPFFFVSDLNACIVRSCSKNYTCIVTYLVSLTRHIAYNCRLVKLLFCTAFKDAVDKRRPTPPPASKTWYVLFNFICIYSFFLLWCISAFAFLIHLQTSDSGREKRSVFWTRIRTNRLQAIRSHRS